ncbi:MAG TPA: hypothetical protein VKD72_30860 [Gemmataceae bacterium]|nr:hypothetical protein [Gemmataceae bacterium]
MRGWNASESPPGRFVVFSAIASSPVIPPGHGKPPDANGGRAASGGGAAWGSQDRSPKKDTVCAAAWELSPGDSVKDVPPAVFIRVIDFARGGRASADLVP